MAIGKKNKKINMKICSGPLVRRYLTIRSMYIPWVVDFGYKMADKELSQTNSKILLKSVKR